MASGTALGSSLGGRKERPLAPPCGRCRNAIERARIGPQAAATELTAAFLREELLSKKSPHARPSSYTSSFTEGETEAQRGLGTHPTDAKLYKIPGI